MKRHRILLAYLGFAAGGFVPIRAEERNAWPLTVQQVDASGGITSSAALGPLFFQKTQPEGGQVSGFRPFYLERTQANGRITSASVLYPLYFYRGDEEAYSWSIFNLINRSGLQPGASPKLQAVNAEKFAVWPFYFSRQTGDAATSYRGLMPVAGSIKNFFGYDRIGWTLFPLYTEVDKHDAHTVLAPWPFLRFTSGAERGFALWPLFGWRERPGEFQRRYALWPLIWDHTQAPAADAPAGTAPNRQIGVLPFYAREQGPGLINENFLWPFFGYTDRTAPYRYHETRYLWPFLVQGHGDERRVNRWGPFYTHSNIKGTDKTWIAWPFWRQVKWQADGLAQTQTQLLFFLYSSLEQHSLRHSSAAPAEKVHVWPLLSAWDNGAGRRQYQFPSPFEALFPNNETVRQNWTPLFALYRYDQRAPGDVRASFFWDAITWTRDDARSRSAFHLGPLLSVQTDSRQKRIALGNGLVGLSRAAGTRAWRFFWLDFSRRSTEQNPAAAR